MRTGIDAQTGKPLKGDARIAQAIRRLLMTDGSLVLRRHLGCALPRLVGVPMNAMNVLVFCAAVTGAITEHEKRVELVSVNVVDDNENPHDEAHGRLALLVIARSRETGQTIDVREPIK